jgi:hypothetical protein
VSGLSQPVEASRLRFLSRKQKSPLAGGQFLTTKKVGTLKNGCIDFNQKRARVEDSRLKRNF